jgi:hypothetical protein
VKTLSFVKYISPQSKPVAVFVNFIGVQKPANVQQISPSNKPDAIFSNYIGVQKPEKILKILKFDILRVPPIQISPKKGKNHEFCSANFTVEQT